MVSFFRSHCHSASETFIGSACCCTRSITLRRTVASSSWSRSAARVSSGVARRTMRRSGAAGSAVGAAAAPAARLHPWHAAPHFLVATAPTADTRPRSWPRSTSTITASCRASASSNGQRKYSLRFPLNRTSTTEFNSFPAECTHRKVLLLAPFEELDDPQLVELGQVAAQRRAERLGRGVGVGVGAARGFGHDLVDDADLQQVLGRGPHGLGRG